MLRVTWGFAPTQSVGASKGVGPMFRVTRRFAPTQSVGASKGVGPTFRVTWRFAPTQSVGASKGVGPMFRVGAQQGNERTPGQRPLRRARRPWRYYRCADRALIICKM